MLLFILIWGWLVSKRELKGNNDKKKRNRNDMQSEED